MAHGSAVRLVFEASRLPLLPGARALAGAGYVTGGCQRNREWLAGKVEIDAALPADLAEVAWDPQTSGGLLVAVPGPVASRVLDALVGASVPAAVVGRVEARDRGAWVLIG
jgi:selenide,water dikinase